ncbi:MAG: LbtU family siderophore porin [Nitrospirae bacterium]|nr:LbtU family siderophore porin [Magnetococcales bacterium]
MKKSSGTILISCMVLSVATAAVADELPSREEMWKLLQQQQREIIALKKQLGTTTPSQSSQVTQSAPETQPEKIDRSGLKWSDRISFSGTVEVEANWNNNHDGDLTTPKQNTSDVTVATAELVTDIKINPWVSGQVILLHEEDGPDKEVDLDQATITIGNAEVTPFFFTGGLMTLPFGSYDTLMVTDPLGLDLGETQESALQLGFNTSYYSGSFYLFNGEAEKVAKDSHLIGYGGNLAYNREYDFGTVHLGTDLISAIEDSDGLTDSDLDETTMFKHIPGLSLHARLDVASWTGLVEYVTALKKLDTSEILWNADGARPWAVNTELGYTWDLLGYATTAAAGYQQTGEAIGLMMPQHRLRGGLKITLFENTDIALEWNHDKDYKTGDSSSVEGGAVRTGTGTTSDSATMQLAVGF